MVPLLAEMMSKYDLDYDYRLPTRSEWVFACMSGYEQRCEENRPNSYGIVGMLNMVALWWLEDRDRPSEVVAAQLAELVVPGLDS